MISRVFVELYAGLIGCNDFGSYPEQSKLFKPDLIT